MQDDIADVLEGNTEYERTGDQVTEVRQHWSHVGRSGDVTEDSAQINLRTKCSSTSAGATSTSRRAVGFQSGSENRIEVPDFHGTMSGQQSKGTKGCYISLQGFLSLRFESNSMKWLQGETASLVNFFLTGGPMLLFQGLGDRARKRCFRGLAGLDPRYVHELNRKQIFFFFFVRRVSFPAISFPVPPNDTRPLCEAAVGSRSDLTFW